MIYTRVIPVLDRFVAVRYIIIAYPSGGRTCSILHCTIFFQTFHWNYKHNDSRSCGIKL